MLDADCAARIAGYHLTALALIAADPDAEHQRQTLLSAEELRFQLEGLAGPRRELPDRRFHELFEERVRGAPGRRRRRCTGTGSGPTGNSTRAPTGWRGPCWPGGCSREGVVAVVTERNLDWMAAGARGLQGRRCVPARSSRTSRPTASRPCSPAPECGLVLTEPGSTSTLDQALDSLPGVAEALRRRGLRGGPRRRRSRRPRRTRPARLHLLHLRLHGRAQGRDVRARGHAQPPLRQDRRPGDRRGAGGRPDRTPVLRHLAVAAGLRRCWSAGGPCWSSRRSILDVQRFLDTIVDGRVARRSRWFPPTWMSCCPTWSSTPASCRTCGACRSPARR